jgi:hypothetical protein
VEPLIWSCSDDASEVWRRFTRDGVCWVRMAGAIEQARTAPARLLEQLIGTAPLVTHVNEIKMTPAIRPGIRSYAVTNDEARFHIDQHPLLPAAVQMLVCVRQASDPGGASMFIDTWKLLDDLAGSALFDQLFDTQRVIRFHNLLWCAPTFSLRAGNLVCVHNGFPRPTDVVGTAFQRLLESQPAIQFRLETGDLLLSNNHRTLHARTAFSDPDRHLIRILAWLPQPMPAPAAYLERADRVATRTEASLAGQPLWIRKRLAFGHEPYDPEDLLEHYRASSETSDDEALLVRAHARTVRRAS